MRLLLFLAAAATAFAQPDTGTITITASRTITATPDQLLYSVTLTTEASITLDEVVARLAGTGITAPNLSFVNSTGSSIDWIFDLVTQFSKMAETNGTLTKLQQQLGRVQLSPALTFRVTTQQTSPDVTAQACSLAALVSDARKEAERLSSAAGVHVGEIVRLSEGLTTLAERQGDFSQLLPYPGNLIPVSGFVGVLSRFAPPLPTPTPACSLVVQFRLVP